MKPFKKKLWIPLTSVFGVLGVGAIIGSEYAFTQGSAAINMALGTSNTITIDDPNAEAQDFFVSKYDYATKENKYREESAKKLFEEDKKSAENATGEGVVLLWNKARALPLKDEKKISLFSHSSVDLVEGGSGSGFIKTESKDGKDASISMKKAFEDKGFTVNPTLWNFYSSGDGSSYKRTNPQTACTEWRVWSVNEAPWSKVNSTSSSFKEYGDCAFITLSRTGGEYSDLHYNYFNPDGEKPTKNIYSKNARGESENTPENGGYLGLTDEEESLFEGVKNLKEAGTVNKVVLLMNTPNQIMFKDIEKYYDGIDACLWIGQPGVSGINAVVDVIKGTINPSGRLPDTFMYDLNSAPATENDGNYQYVGEKDYSLTNNNNRYNSYMVYQEGIYVGYRYYETRYEDLLFGVGNASSNKGSKNNGISGWDYKKEVAFPFGYGDSYTKFEYSGFSANKDKDGNVTIKVTVKNTGSVAGKEVVQAYLQKPYTSYDKQNGIEKSAVELAGYKKTKVLKASDSEEVSIVIPYESFKTYDANVAKTYIVEGGNYYVTLANDAHNAINNIVAKKDSNKKSAAAYFDKYIQNYVRNNTATINEDFTKMFEFAQDNETFSVSTQTGEAITNQFDEGDINKYSHRGTNSVTYLSRNNWEATYPSTPTLTLNDNFVEDLRPSKTPDDAGLSMPNYSKFKSGASGSANQGAGDVVAYQFMEAPLFPEYASEEDKRQVIDGKPYVQYWNDMWDQLLDEMTWEEQALMSANAYHQINGAQSISLPSSKQENGPVGITNRGTQFPVPDQGIAYYYYVSYPCASLIAATFNPEVAEDVGNHMSEDMLFLGYNGIYGPGVNMHRTPYGGRAYEYPSEDPYLAGTIEYSESKGIESQGCLAFAKHFALNDTETNRRHVGVWSNEQATREIYLRAFELTFAEGGASATMNSFSRIGTRWNGGCKEIMTNVLRKEWGWDGINITDWATGGPMSYVDAIVAGTNSFDGNGTSDEFKTWKNNAAVAQGLRFSAKCTIFNVVRTNAMNGTSINTRVLKVTPWWITVVKVVVGVLLSIFGASAVMLGLCFIFGFKKNKETNEVTNLAEGSLKVGKKEFDKAKVGKIVAIVTGSAGLLAAIITTLVPVSKNIAENKAIDDIRKQFEAEIVPEDDGEKVSHIFEFETANIEGVSQNTKELHDHVCFGDSKDGSLVFSEKFSGGLCIRNISSDKMTFKFTSDKTVKTEVTMRLASSRASAGKWKEQQLQDAYTITNNGKRISLSNVIVPAATSADKTISDYFAMVSVTFPLDVHEGENELVFLASGSPLNPDCLDIKTSAKLRYTPEFSLGKHNEVIEVSQYPTMAGTGTIKINCKHEGCNKSQTYTLPALTNEFYSVSESGYHYANIYGKKVIFD